MKPTHPTSAPASSTDAGLKVSDFDFHLPEELIAQQPPAERGASRMLIVQREQQDHAEAGQALSEAVRDFSHVDQESQKIGQGFSPGIFTPNEDGALAPEVSNPAGTSNTAPVFTDSTFAHFPRLLTPGDLLVLNDSRVIPARLYARRANSRGKQEPSGQIEVLLTSPASPNPAAETDDDPTSIGVPGGQQIWHALVRPGRKVRPGDTLAFYAEGAGVFRPLNKSNTQRGFSPGIGGPLLEAEVLSSGEFGARTLRFVPTPNFFSTLDRIGHMPLPPYIHRSDAAPDRERYQTVYSHERGSVAAPTAGLHFTPQILEAIQSRGVEIARITLHVGLGTFAPLRVERLSEIRLHTERYTLSPETADALNRARAENRRIIAVGTTVVRTLEHCALTAEQSSNPLLEPHTGETSIFISPGHRFRLVRAMLTNFHLPQSSLLMLVSAFAGQHDGRQRILAAYNHAVQQKYRFFSYGDCMFLH